MERLIFHIDVNSAFLSWEAARRVKEGLPDLRKIPAVIGGDPKKRTGVVLAKSIPAKKCGIRTGEPMAMAVRKCPNLVSVRSDFELYDRCSKAFKAICASYAPVMESFSIDEVFLDMSGTHYIYPDPIATAHEIKDKIKEELGFTVNVGIGPNKLLAKMASDFEKPDKVHTLFIEEIPSKMWPLPVGDLLFLGRKSVVKLNHAEIYTIGDLAHRSEKEIQYILGNKAGHQLYQYANGIDDTPVKAVPDDPKGYSVETTFDENIKTLEQAFLILLTQVDVVAARMRRDGNKCTCVSVVFRNTEFKNKSHQCKIEGSTDVTDEIYLHVKRLFKESWNGEPLRLIGVALTGITDEDYEQISFFEKPVDRTKNKKLDQAVDEIRLKFGNGMISRASTLNKGAKIGRKAKAQMENQRRKPE
ncbi:MAG: DNA polymerase IV [Lachnospiraceae bacterium]|nr:DNA polymerase IV [Lachnospiraceae bacterium]